MNAMPDEKELLWAGRRGAEPGFYQMVKREVEDRCPL